MTHDEFAQLVGSVPENDDLERVNCEVVGTAGHEQCGICRKCGYPRFIPKFDKGELVCDHRGK